MVRCNLFIATRPSPSPTIKVVTGTPGTNLSTFLVSSANIVRTPLDPSPTKTIPARPTARWTISCCLLTATIGVVV